MKKIGFTLVLAAIRWFRWMQQAIRDGDNHSRQRSLMTTVTTMVTEATIIVLKGTGMVRVLHDGTVADWGGGKYHVEFTVDHDKQQATVYVFGSDEKTPAPIDAASIELSIGSPEMQVALKASPQESDPAGKASRFIGTHEKLGVVQEYAGTLTGVIDGTPYSGDFKEEAHGDHSH